MALILPPLCFLYILLIPVPHTSLLFIFYKSCNEFFPQTACDSRSPSQSVMTRCGRNRKQVMWDIATSIFRAPVAGNGDPGGPGERINNHIHAKGHVAAMASWRFVRGEFWDRAQH